MKKTISIILALALLLTSAPLGGLVGLDLPRLTANAETTGDNDNLLIYEEYDDHAVITGYWQEAASIEIPSSINGKPVTRISDFAFDGCSTLESITIPTSVTSIGYCAFRGTAYYSNKDNWENGVLYIGNHLIEAEKDIANGYTIKNDTKTIARGAFYGCSSLKSITIPDSVTSIANSAFWDCSSLESITIPDSVTSIGDWAFCGCSSLASITIPDSVVSIGDCAFFNCSSLASITIGSSVTSIGDFAFDGCSSLQSITIPDSVVSIGDSVFSYCESLASITIPDSVTSIGDSVFSYCESLQSITIGSSVTSISDFAFDGCSSLQSVKIPDSVTSIGDSAFYNCISLESITIPDSVTSIGYWAFSGCSSLKSITIPDSVTSIGYWAFSGCSSLASITIGSSVTSIGNGAFEDCSSLASITIPDSVTSIGDSAFYNCSSLASIAIPDSVTSIGNGAFSHCESLQSITIGSSVTSIGDFAFHGCSSLQSVKIPDSVTSIGDWAFFNCSSLESITIPDSVTSIGAYAFNGCSSLQSITIPSSVTSIGNGAFSHCESLQSITIPSSVTSIGDSVFSYCESLQSITIGSSVTSIGDFAFDGCSSLQSITIPDSVTSIGSYAFSSCSSLASITIGSSVTSIGNSAFSGCSSLESITIPTSVTSIGDSAFWDCSSLQSITIPSSVTSIGDGVFTWCTSLSSINLDEENESYCLMDGVLYDKEMTALICCPAKKAVTEYTIPSTVTSIGMGAFSGCQELSGVTIPGSVTRIGRLAFDSTGLMSNSENWDNGLLYLGKHLIRAEYVISGSYTIKSGTITIADGAFAWIEELTGVDLPSSLISIGESAFSDCSSLQSIAIPSSVTSIGDRAFFNCSSLQSITIPDSLISIGEEAFIYTAFYNDVSNWEDGVLYLGKHLIDAEEDISGSYTIKSGTISIADYAFMNCGITSITIPASVKSIGSYVFRETSIEDFIVDDDNASYCSVDGVLFNKDQTRLIWYSKGKYRRNYIIPDSVTSIEPWAFSYCYLNKNIAIPTSVKSIGENAFVLLDEDITIYYGGTENQWKQIKISAGNTSLNNVGIVFNSTLSVHANIEILPSKPATCSETGLSEGEKCKDCGEILVEQMEIPIDPDNHAGETYIKDAKAADCINDGYTGDAYCEDCDAKLADGTAIPALTHDMGEWYVKTEASCTTKGTEKRDCLRTDCGYSETREIPIAPDNHAGGIYIDNAKPADCINDGYTGDAYCGDCGAKLADGTAIPALTHDMGEWYVKTEASCITKGTEKRDCLRTDCGYSETREIPINPGMHRKVVLYTSWQPTCEEEGGSGGIYCRDCNTYIKGGERIPALGHNFGEWTIVREASYAKEGEMSRSCDRDGCGKLETKPIPKLVAEKEYSNNATGITVKTQKNTFGVLAKLNVQEENEGDSFKLLDEEKGDCNFVLYDISFEAVNKPVQPDGKILVGIPLPEGYSEDSTFAYYVGKEGLEKLDSYYEDGKIWFEIDHLSPYALVDESSGSSEKPTEPTTKPTEPTTKPTEPTTKPTQPTTKPTQPTTKPTEPTAKPTQPTTKPTEPTTKPTESTEKPTEPIVNFLLGDVNGDGHVKANDARTALRAAAKLQELDEKALKAADLDGNGKVTAAEARKILRFAARLDKELG